MKFLIIQTAFIGDVVLVTPIIESLRMAYPEAQIDVLVRKHYEQLLADHPHVHETWTFDKKHKSKEMLRLIKAFRATGYDYIINAQRFMSSGLITLFSGAKHSIGFNKNPMSFGFGKRIPHHISISGSEHEVDRNLALIHGLVKSTIRKPKLYPRPSDYKRVPEVPYVCLAPGSKWFTKTWPKEKWVALAHAIPKKYRILLMGGPEDLGLCEKIKDEFIGEATVQVMAGKTHMLEAVALIEKAQMTFTNDSAPLHFASATNAPVMAIFCSTVPAYGFGPLSDGATIAETHHSLDCKPCGLHGKAACPKGHFKCADIEIASIIKEARL